MANDLLGGDRQILVRRTLLLKVERTSKLGRLGEQLAAECLQAAGFTGIRNLNRGVNFPYADIIASEAGKTYFIGVKARNEFRDIGPLNSSYNAVKIRDSKNRELKALGKTEANITSIVWGGG